MLKPYLVSKVNIDMFCNNRATCSFRQRLLELVEKEDLLTNLVYPPYYIRIVCFAQGT